MNTDQLEQLLQFYDRDKAQYLISGFRQGFHLHYKGTRKNRDCKNLKSTHQHPEVFKQKVQKEVELGRYIGPFKSPPIPNLQCSPLGLVPKKGNPGKLRLIMHLSYPRGDSVNDFIPKEFSSVHYKSFDVAIKLCLMLNIELIRMDILILDAM